ncbi:MAG TPA: CHAT domain-containing protein [Pyrinomonadaceae bacterium]|nr:CHAT domain-containing protein [Pyrinomonadaceae bacterium]
MAGEQNKLKEYLLGQLTEAEEEQVELRLLTEPDFAEEYDMVVDELTDDYVAGKFAGNELVQMEQHFFKSPERQSKLKFAQALRLRKSNVEPPKPVSWFKPLLAIAAALVLVVGGFYIWRIRSNDSELNQGLAALQSAFRDARPVEARLSSLHYAPYSTTRGPGTEKINQDELRRAELTLLNAAKNNPTAAVHHGLGQVYLAKKEFDRAIKEFDEALKGDPTNPQLYSDLGAAWMEKGKIDLNGKEPGKGMEALGHSLENLNKALGLDPNLLDALFNRALSRQLLKNDQQAKTDWQEYLRRDPSSSWAEEARQKLRLIEEREEKTSRNKERLLSDFVAAYQVKDSEAAWGAISSGRERKGNLIVEQLLDDYLQLSSQRPTGEADETLKKLFYEGWIEEHKAGDRFTSDLIAFYKKATPQQLALSIQARRVVQSAMERYYKAEFEAALMLFQKAREVFTLAGNESEGLFADSWTGYCNLRIPKVKDALEAFTRLSQIYERKSYRSLHAQSLNALSDAELTLNEFSKALAHADRSLMISKEINDTVNVVRTYGQVASILLNLGSYRESLGSAFQGLSVAETSVYDPSLLWRFYHEAALAFYHSGLQSAALDSESEAERLADIAANPLLKARSLDRRALLYEQLHDYETAIMMLHQALREGEKISGESSRAVTQIHTMLSLGQLYRTTGNLPQSIQYYDRTLEFSERLNNLEIYLYRARKGKLLALLDMHDDLAAEQELGRVVSLFEAYRDKIVDESYRNGFFDIGQNTYDIAIEFEYSRRGNAEKAFQYAEACRARSLFDLMTNTSRVLSDADRPDRLMSGTKPLTLLEVQRSISDQVQILQYSVLDDKLLIWVVTKDGLKHVEAKIKATVLDETIHRYRTLLLKEGNTRENEDITALAKQLYDYLITPVESRGYLKAEHQLCIVPDKSLNFLPFAALISPTSGRYLIETFALELAPSATIFAMSTQNAKLRAQPLQESLLSVGNPSFDSTRFSDLPNLPAATREAQQIAAFYNSSPVIEGLATPARVKRDLLTADVAHFATHALLNEKSPLMSGLLLANGGSSEITAHHLSPGLLQASEIYTMTLPRTRLVVLSACQTGIERAYRGEGAISLARPFLAAGVPLVVASLWPVNSETTAELMINFHKYRKEGRLSTVRALQQAQIDSIKSLSQNSREPNTWAAFVPIGGYASF